MFDEESYAYIKNSYYFKHYWRYCFIGATALFVIGAIMIVFATLRLDDNILIAMDIIGALFMLFPLFFMSFRRVKPYICTVGKIVSKRGFHAVVEINGKKIRATSIEHFLKCRSLKEYAIDDEVVVYCMSKIFIRPVFYSARLFEADSEEDQDC